MAYRKTYNKGKSKMDVTFDRDSRGNKTRCVWFDGKLVSRTYFKPIVKSGVTCGYEGYQRRRKSPLYSFLITPVFKKGMSKSAWENMQEVYNGGGSQNRTIRVNRGGSVQELPAFQLKIREQGGPYEQTYLGYEVPGKTGTFFFPGINCTIVPQKCMVIYNK